MKVCFFLLSMKHDFNSYFYINHVSLTFIDDNHDQGTQLVLKGIDKQSDIGLLSLFEHYKSIKVGNNLKNPKFPIWVICSESHFTVLFRYWFWFHAYLIFNIDIRNQIYFLSQKIPLFIQHNSWVMEFLSFVQYNQRCHWSFVLWPAWKPTRADIPYSIWFRTRPA